MTVPSRIGFFFRLILEPVVKVSVCWTFVVNVLTAAVSLDNHPECLQVYYNDVDGFFLRRNANRIWV